jgi:hypothetical protein
MLIWVDLGTSCQVSCGFMQALLVPFNSLYAFRLCSKLERKILDLLPRKLQGKQKELYNQPCTLKNSRVPRD